MMYTRIKKLSRVQNVCCLSALCFYQSSNKQTNNFSLKKVKSEAKSEVMGKKVTTPPAVVTWYLRSSTSASFQPFQPLQEQTVWRAPYWIGFHPAVTYTLNLYVTDGRISVRLI